METSSYFALLRTLIILGTNVAYGSRTRHQKNIGLVRNISSSQTVEDGSSVELECRLRNVPDRAEVAWARIKGVDEVEYLSIYNKEDGVIDYEEEQYTSVMEEDEDGWVWKLILSQITMSAAGMYQCEVGCR